MYGTFSGIAYGFVAGAILLVIALALFASPLFALIIALLAAVGLVIGMAALRRRSRSAEADHVRRNRAPGEPASGEG
jgi:membrane protein implicated in regulation of membrane protease activity